jgi:hypothetical protein
MHIKAKRVASGLVNRIRRAAFGAEPPPYVDWGRILRAEQAAWHAARRAARGGPKILIGTSTGGFGFATTAESLLAVALTLRGADVHLLLCDEALPACLFARYIGVADLGKFAEQGLPRSMCEKCFPCGSAAYRQLGLPVHHYGRLLTEKDRQIAADLSQSVGAAELPEYRMGRIAAGEHAWAGTLRFFGRGDLEGQPYGEQVLRRYFEGALRATFAGRRLLARHAFSSVCLHHGLYVPQGLLGEVARERDVRVVTWNPAYRKHCFVFSHEDTYHRTLITEPTSHWDDMEWNAETERQIDEYIKSRWQGSKDWIWFREKTEEETSSVIQDLRIDPDKPCIGMLTNVVWDAQLHYRGMAFGNMIEWVLATIRYFAERPDLQLLLRVHPAEAVSYSRQPLLDEIRQAFPVLPPNVFIVPPECPASTYELMERCSTALIYGTKMGVELSSMGVPVIVAGDAWIRDKGITMDAHSAEEYFAFLDRLPLTEPMDAETVARARKYAFHFFFRRMIPVSLIEPTANYPGVTPYELGVTGLDQLRAGRNAGLDVICNGILNGSEFIYPAECLT